MREHSEFIPSFLRRSRAAVRRTRPGFSLLEIMVVVAIFSIIISIGFPNYIRARTSARTRGCVKQIRTLTAAKEQYALIRKVPSGAAVSMGNLIAEELINSEPTCPDGFPYTLGTVGEDAVCTSGLPGHTHNGPY
jgi:prepilin-type N-terminal cleavage/methylation domain-containing protein